MSVQFSYVALRAPCISRRCCNLLRRHGAKM